MIGSFAAKTRVTELHYEAEVTTFSEGYVSVGEEGFESVWVSAGVLDCATVNIDGSTPVSAIVVLQGLERATAVDLKRDTELRNGCGYISTDTPMRRGGDFDCRGTHNLSLRSPRSRDRSLGRGLRLRGGGVSSLRSDSRS